jgi:REP element-mobilizing transposase RayT
VEASDAFRALFLTWRTYGTWLPGDERGWVDERRNGKGEPTHRPDYRLEQASKGLMRSPEMRFSDAQRQAVDDAVRETCASEGWQVLGLNVRTNHVHIVLGGDEFEGDVMVTLKKEATKRLRTLGLAPADARVWSRRGSRRVLSGRESVEQAVDYVLNRQ